MRLWLSASRWAPETVLVAGFGSSRLTEVPGVCVACRFVGPGQPARPKPAQQQPVGPERAQQQLVGAELHGLHVRLLALRVPPVRGREAEDRRLWPHGRVGGTGYAWPLASVSACWPCPGSDLPRARGAFCRGHKARPET